MYYFESLHVHTKIFISIFKQIPKLGAIKLTQILKIMTLLYGKHGNLFS